MKNLIQRLVGGVAALGLVGCVSNTDVKLSEPAPSAAIVKVPDSIDYNTVAWDRAYFGAITGRGGVGSENEIVLFSLQFESYLQGKEGVRVVRELSFDEVNALGIKTRQDLAAYLGSRCKEYSGYLGPKIFL